MSRAKLLSTTFVAIATGALSVAACESADSETGGGTQAPTPPGSLPSMGFLQIGDGPSEAVIDTFARDERNGALIMKHLSQGRDELWVDDGGKRTKIAPAGHYLTPHAVVTQDFRAACVTEFSTRLAGDGPVGEVYELRRDVAPELVCYVNALKSSKWQRVLIERGSDGEKNYALWALIVTPAASPDDPTTGRALEVMYVRDSYFDAGWMSNAGRPSSDITVEATLTMTAGGAFQVAGKQEFQTYFDAAMFAGASVPTCTEEMCGQFFNGLFMQECEAQCGSGQTCKSNFCSDEECTPLTAAEACATEPDEAKRCGEVVDGCGGTVDCGGCSGNETCGGGGLPSFCGQYKMAEARLRQAYEDVDGELCGKFDDLAGGTLDLGTSCANGGECTNNLCVKN